MSWGSAYYYSRRYQEAIGRYTRAIELEPTLVGPHLWRAQALIQLGRADDAAEGIVTAFTYQGLPRDAALVFAEALTGQGPAAPALQLLRELEARPDIDRSILAQFAAWLGDASYSIELLEQAYQNHDHRLLDLAVEPLFDGVRDEPAVQELLARLGLS